MVNKNIANSIICLLMAIAVCSNFIFIGCGNTGAQPVTTRPAVPIEKPVLEPAPDVSPTGEVKGTLNLYSEDPLTLDPATAGDGTSHEYILQVFSGLVCLSDSMKPVADIAHSCSISDDCKVYTFNLRHGVKFHDGREVKAEDFKYSWERACNPDTRSLTARSILGDIAGVADVLDDKTKEISGLKVVDEYTLQVTLNAPITYFFIKLTHPVAFVVDKNNVISGNEWWRKPNGTGPFLFGKWEKGKSLVLNRNADYYSEQAKVESINFHLLEGRPIDMYEKGDIDVAGVTTGYIERATDPTGSLSKELKITHALGFSYIGFNTKKPPFDDVNVRLAFCCAVDKEKLAKLTCKNMAEQAGGILPPGMPGYNKDLHVLGYDVARAKELIARSKYATSMPPITMTVSGVGGDIQPLQQSVIEEWRRNLGIEVKVRQIEPERFLYHLKEEKDELFSMAWSADYPHPQDFLEGLFRTNSEHNYGEFSDAEIDDMLKKAALETDNALSLEMYQQAEQKLVDRAACVPLIFWKNYVVIKPYVKGYALNPQGFSMLNTVSITSH